MKNVFKLLMMASLLIGCFNPNIELNPVKKVTECLIREISTVRGVKPSFVIETQEFKYDENGNPTSWVIKNEGNYVTWELNLFYEKNKLIRVEKNTYILDSRLIKIGVFNYIQEKHSIKNFKINTDFSEIIVDRSNFNYDQRPAKDPVLLPDNKQILKFKRNPENEIKFVRLYDLIKFGDIKSIAYNYGDNLMNNVISKEFYKNNNDYTPIFELTKRSKGFWKNVKNPFSANIYLSLIADYNTNSGYDIEGGNWNDNMENIDPLNNFISNYETNAEGFPCRLTTKNSDFSPYPLEVRYYYNNCDCK